MDSDAGEGEDSVGGLGERRWSTLSLPEEGEGGWYEEWGGVRAVRVRRACQAVAVLDMERSNRPVNVVDAVFVAQMSKVQHRVVLVCCFFGGKHVCNSLCPFSSLLPVSLG